MSTPSSGKNPCLINIPPLMAVKLSCTSDSVDMLNPQQKVSVTIEGSNINTPEVIFQGGGNDYPMPVIFPTHAPNPDSFFLPPAETAYSLSALFQYGNGTNNRWENNTAVTENFTDQGSAVIKMITSDGPPDEATLTIEMIPVPPPAPVYQFNTEPPEILAQSLPVSASDEIPGIYPTKVIIPDPGNPCFVIQLWKGFCPNLPLLMNLVGGIGAEVGIYLKNDPDDKSWKPDFEHLMPISYILYYPGPHEDATKNKIFFTADTQICWWRHKWMQPESYAVYRVLNPDAPENPADYKLYYQVGDYSGIW